VKTVREPEYRDLLKALLRARAFESLYEELPDLEAYPSVAPRRISPAVPAAFSLRRREDGTGDLFSLRRGSPASALVFGLPADALFRQALGRVGAPAGGRDPGGFPTDLSRGLLAPVPSPGTLVEVMAGAALSFRLRDQDRVALLVDDIAGSASGFWHEGLNFAAVQRAPFVLVVDAVAAAGAEGSRSAATTGLLAKAPAYGLEGHAAPADDPLALAEVLARAVTRAREGHGVQLVEVSAAKGGREDPIATLAGRLRWAEALRDDELETWSADAVREMETSLAAVVAEPAPDDAEAGAPVYVGGTPGRPPWLGPAAPVTRTSDGP
jgi:pyruvate dehydrogenase E1 component alpha subunit/2-oxoisovalerate dehydrogenase E1 component alpha subunit